MKSEHRHEIDAEAREVRDVRAIVYARGAQHVLRLPVERAHVGVECVPVEQLLPAHFHSRVCDRYDTPIERQVVLEERESTVNQQTRMFCTLKNLICHHQRQQINLKIKLF